MVMSIKKHLYIRTHIHIYEEVENMRKIIVEIVIGGSGIIQPSQLPLLLQRVSEVVPPAGTEPVVISGRLPVWAYGALVHHFHPRPYIATFEPRLGMGVVVASHTSDVDVGDLINLDNAEKIVVNFP